MRSNILHFKMCCAHWIQPSAKTVDVSITLNKKPQRSTVKENDYKFDVENLPDGILHTVRQAPMFVSGRTKNMQNVYTDLLTWLRPRQQRHSHPNESCLIQGIENELQW